MNYTARKVLELVKYARETAGVKPEERIDLDRFYSLKALAQMQEAVRAGIAEYALPVIRNGDDIRNLAAGLCRAVGVSFDKGVPIELVELAYGKDAVDQIASVMQQEEAARERKVRKYDVLFSRRPRN